MSEGRHHSNHVLSIVALQAIAVPEHTLFVCGGSQDNEMIATILCFGFCLRSFPSVRYVVRVIVH